MKIDVLTRKFRIVNMCVIGVVMLLVTSPSISQKTSAFSLFESDSIINIRLITDMKLFVKNKFKEEYQPAVIQIIQQEGDTVSYTVKIRSRGNIRKEQCRYPPIKVKFSKKDFEYNKLKWVNTCFATDKGDQLLLKEYLAYKLYGIFSDRGFRTKLLRVEYVNTGKDDKTDTRYAFFIENDEALASRLGGRLYSPKALKQKLIDPDQLALFTMFNYMIANTDWSIENRHNLEAMTDSLVKAVVAIPYDFDYAGFVGTSYAAVHESLPNKSVKERYNSGYCIDDEICEKYRQIFISKRDEVLRTCREFEYFDDRSKKETEFFLKSFFDLMENEKNVKEIFTKKCKPAN